MESIGAAKFKEHCLSLLDSVGPDGLIITKHGKPVAKLIPYPEKPDAIIGSLVGKLSIHGDIFSTGESWEALGD